MNCFLEIFKVNELREGVGKESGRAYRMQDCECAILNEQGAVEEVGVLLLGEKQVGHVAAGLYAGSFALRASKAKDAGRKIVAVLVDLVPVHRTPKGLAPLPAAKPATPAGSAA